MNIAFTDEAHKNMADTNEAHMKMIYTMQSLDIHIKGTDMTNSDLTHTENMQKIFTKL